MDRQSKCLALEKKYVYDVYDSTAHHFRDVRYKAWPKVRAFLTGLEPASLVIDVGCGSGKYLHINKEVFKLGCDRSPALVDIARTRHHEMVTCDNLHLPYRDNVFDAVISIGVIHHLTTRERRVGALRELARILRPGGKLMVYVWAMEQRTRRFDAQDVLVPWHLQPSMKQKRKKDINRKGDNADASDDENDDMNAEHRARRKSSGSRATPISQYKGLYHHQLGDGVTPCQERRRSFHLTKQNVISHGSTSSCNTPNTSLDQGNNDDYGTHKTIAKRQSSLKDWVSNLFTKPFSPREVTYAKIELKVNKLPIKLNENEYKKMMTQIFKEDLEMFQRHRPLLEHSLSAPETGDFAVREFPQSSQPMIKKNQSLDSHPGRAEIKFNTLTSDKRCGGRMSTSSFESNEIPIEDYEAGRVSYNNRDYHYDSFDFSGRSSVDSNLEGRYQNTDLLNVATEGYPVEGHVPTTTVNADEGNHDFVNGNVGTRTEGDGYTVYTYPPSPGQMPDESEHISAKLAVKRIEVPRLEGCLTSSVSCSGDDEPLTFATTSSSSGRNGVLPGGVLASQSDNNSSPDSTSPDRDCMEESSMSSPEDNMGPGNGGDEDGLNGLLQEVEGIQYPSLSDSEADEWERVTVKAIRTMKTEVLRHVGSSMDSITSRQAVVGSSCDLEDVDDYDDQRSPRWIDPHGGTSVRQRLTPGGSETSSFSSDPYTESDLDDGDGHPSPSPREGQKFEFVFNTEARTMSSPSRLESLNHPRRKVFRRFVSMNEPLHRSDLPSSPPPIIEEPGNNRPNIRRSPSPREMKRHKMLSTTLPTSPLQDLPNCDQFTSNANHLFSSPEAENPSIIVEKPRISLTSPEESFDANMSVESNGACAVADGSSSSHNSPHVKVTSESQPPPVDGSSSNETTYHRYYHVFRQGELVTLIENQVEQLHTLESYYDNANWCVIAEKVQVWKI